LKIDIESQDIVKQLRIDINNFQGKLEINAAGTRLKSTTRLKAILRKENIYNIPNKLKKFKPILGDENLCINWIDWKNKGFDFDEKGICPFCSDKLQENYQEEKEVFHDTYKKSDAQNLKEMLDLFNDFHKYLIEEKYKSLISCVKEEKDEATINAVLKGFVGDYQYIYNKLDAMEKFDTSVFRKVNIATIDSTLEQMRIDDTALNYFGSTLMQNITHLINDKIDELCQEASSIKQAMGELQSILKKAISASKKDINLFLKAAGIEYDFNLDTNDDGSAVAHLMYKGTTTVDSIRDHLSWGEKNALSLILFMFYSLSQEADLIILDDPISSFDTNKKYAIIYRLFSKQTGVFPRSFYEKTALMLTHDFEPIIDFVVVGKLPMDKVSAKFIENVDGKLQECDINNKKDIHPVVEGLKTHISNEDLDMVCRITFLRKLYEHMGKENYQEAYDVLSSLIHGRPQCTYNDGITKIPQEEINKGVQEIKKLITSFDYEQFRKEYFCENVLKEKYFRESNRYLKVIIFRALYEIRMISDLKKNDALDDTLFKYINESYHIENDYAYYLDAIKFSVVPEYIVHELDKYMTTHYKSSVTA
ncbi:MAG: AAA family ATPase, partial [Megasphaera sp.]|nr:AAA family ATPase [Megasphaera sp.]